jgi:hypothetical protein
VGRQLFFVLSSNLLEYAGKDLIVNTINPIFHHRTMVDVNASGAYHAHSSRPRSAKIELAQSAVQYCRLPSVDKTITSHLDLMPSITRE